jgi:hypothetical protein
LACWIDNTGELASLMLRAGNAGSNTATDLIALLAEAIAQVPKPYRRKLLVTCDSAGASHDLVNWLIRQSHAPTGGSGSPSASTSMPTYVPRSPSCEPTAGCPRWTTPPVVPGRTPTSPISPA